MPCSSPLQSARRIGTARHNADGLENADRFHRDGASDGVVRCARRRMPRVEMPAEHHDLVGRTGDFGDRVVARPAFRIEAIDDVELELDVLAIREQPRDASVVFVAQYHGRNGSARIVRVVGKRPDLTVVAARIVHAHARAGRDQKVIDLRAELTVRERLTFRGYWLLRGWWRAATGRRRCVQDLQHLAIFATLRHVVERHGDLLMRANEDDLSPDGAPQRVEMRCELLLGGTGRQRDLHCRSLYRTVGPRCPGKRFCDEMILYWRDDMSGEPLVQPAGIAPVPRLHAAVLQSPRFELFDRPTRRRPSDWATRSGEGHIGRSARVPCAGCVSWWSLPAESSSMCRGRCALVRRAKQTPRETTP